MNNYLEKLPKWNYFLPFESEEFLNEYLNKKIGINENHSLQEREVFIDQIYKSLSLGKIEKERLLFEYKNLDKFQLDSLKDVFNEEIAQFGEIEKDKNLNEELQWHIYSNILAWGLIMDDKYADIIFIEKFLPKEKYIGNINELVSILDFLLDNKKYSSVCILSKRILDKNPQSEELYSLCNTFLYAKSCTKDFFTLDDFDYNLEINEFNLSENKKNKLAVNYIFYIALSHGFFLIKEQDFSFILHCYRTKSVKFNQYHFNKISLYYFSNGNKYSFMKAQIKTIKTILDSKSFDISDIDSFYKRISSKKKDTDGEKTFIDYMADFILSMCLFNYKLFETKILEYSSLIYDKCKEFIENNIEGGFYISAPIALFEILLDKKDISQKRQFEFSFIDKDTDSKYLFEINHGFNSSDSIIFESKKILATYDNYTACYYYVSVLAVFLIKKSHNNEQALYILKSVASFCEEKGYFSKFDVMNFLDLFSNTERSISDRDKDLLNLI